MRSIILLIWCLIIGLGFGVCLYAIILILNFLKWILESLIKRADNINDFLHLITLGLRNWCNK